MELGRKRVEGEKRDIQINIVMTRDLQGLIKCKPRKYNSVKLTTGQGNDGTFSL